MTSPTSWSWPTFTCDLVSLAASVPSEGLVVSYQLVHSNTDHVLGDHDGSVLSIVLAAGLGRDVR